MKKTVITCDEKQEKIILCDTGRAILNLNEREVEVSEIEGDGTETTVTKYQYDNVTLEAPVLTEAAALASVKTLKAEDINAYDKSDNVNAATLDGKAFWYDKSTRVGLVNGIGQEQAAGKEKTTLWVGTTPHEMPIDDALSLLSKLELYAIDCNNATRTHLAEVEALSDIEAAFNYDITDGYPERLAF